MPKNRQRPPIWSRSELEDQRHRSERFFCEERRKEGRESFNQQFEEDRKRIENALACSADLTEVTPSLFESDDRIWEILRYFCAPPISEEDYWTLVGKKFRRVPREFAIPAAEVINDLLDIRRMPWIAKKRKPTSGERETAILVTATLLAHESHRTGRRGLVSKAQEDAVALALDSAGLVRLPSKDRRRIESVEHLPPGSFCKEQKILAAKCDVPSRLFDGRLFAIECKVSNGPKNSWKRLLREVGGKADTWRGTFNDDVITGAVIAGVFDLKCLERAQDEHGIALFWQHDLTPLTRFVSEARPK